MDENKKRLEALLQKVDTVENKYNNELANTKMEHYKELGTISSEIVALREKMSEKCQTEGHQEPVWEKVNILGLGYKKIKGHCSYCDSELEREPNKEELNKISNFYRSLLNIWRY